MRKILYICGSRNQTTMMHKISQQMQGYDNFFTPYYADGAMKYFSEKGLLEFTVMGKKLAKICENYLNAFDLKIDYRGEENDYDLVFTCSDLIVPKNIKRKKMILVQEGMTDPENLMYYFVKWFGLPRYLASTSTTGLSNAYDFFCVASEGYRELFIKKGIKPEKLIVTGIPNFDNLETLFNNEFPHKDFVLVATSDTRETFKYENRNKFIKEAIQIADGRQLIFKLHPNENFERAKKEIKEFAPDALIYTKGNIDEMIANCHTLVTKYSTVVYVGLVLQKKVYSYFDINQLRELAPIQNGGNSAKNISCLAKSMLETFEYSYNSMFEEWALTKGY